LVRDVLTVTGFVAVNSSELRCTTSRRIDEGPGQRVRRRSDGFIAGLDVDDREPEHGGRRRRWTDVRLVEVLAPASPE
jgi:hypothetical protein